MAALTRFRICGTDGETLTMENNDSRTLNQFAIDALESLIANVEAGVVVRSGSMNANG